MQLPKAFISLTVPLSAFTMKFHSFTNCATNILRFLLIVLPNSEAWTVTSTDSDFLPPTRTLDPLLTGGDIEGDIKLSPNSIAFLYGTQLRNGISGLRFRWPNNIVPVIIDAQFSPAEALTIQNALSEITRKTCVKFVPKNNNERDYVFVSRGAPFSGCWSYIGRIGGQQNVNLDVGCIVHGIVMHEMLHVLGFWHEQSRMDRDDYVTVNLRNVLEKERYNFEKHPVLTYGVPYDYGSIMHYDGYAFAINPYIPTIIAKGGQVLGQRSRLSDADALKINQMYRCT